MNDLSIMGGFPNDAAERPPKLPSADMVVRRSGNATSSLRSHRDQTVSHVPVKRKWIPFAEHYYRIRSYFIDSPAPLGLYVDYYA